jgi:hypothetical protein
LATKNGACFDASSKFIATDTNGAKRIKIELIDNPRRCA